METMENELQPLAHVVIDVCVGIIIVPTFERLTAVNVFWVFENVRACVLSFRGSTCRPVSIRDVSQLFSHFNIVLLVLRDSLFGWKNPYSKALPTRNRG